MNWLLVASLLVGCTGSSKPEKAHTTDTSESPAPIEDQAIRTLREKLATAKMQSNQYLSGAALPVGGEVRALVEKDGRDWWKQLTPIESFFLFEISPTVAGKAPADVRANAFCAGVAEVSGEWWSIPGSKTSETVQHALAAKLPIGPCLVKLFDSTTEPAYDDGESNIHAETYHWTVGDLAAGIVAVSLGETYESSVEPEKRAARRAELRAKVH